MHGLALIYIVRDRPGIRGFRIVQETLQFTRVELAVAEDFDRAQVPEIVAAFRQRLGTTVEIHVEFVEAIAPERSGKYRYVVSRVAVAQ